MRLLALGGMLLCLSAGATDAREDSSARFLDAVQRKPEVSRRDCVLAAALVASPRKWTDEYDACRKILGGFEGIHIGDVAVREKPGSRGYASHLFVRVLGIKGGVILRGSRSSHRYAYRELDALAMIAGGGAQNTMTGEELAGLIQAAGRYKKENGRR